MSNNLFEETRLRDLLHSYYFKIALELRLI